MHLSCGKFTLVAKKKQTEEENQLQATATVKQQKKIVSKQLKQLNKQVNVPWVTHAKWVARVKMTMDYRENPTLNGFHLTRSNH